VSISVAINSAFTMSIHIPLKTYLLNISLLLVNTRTVSFRVHVYFFIM